MCLFAFIFERRTNFCIWPIWGITENGMDWNIARIECILILLAQHENIKNKINNSNSKNRISAEIYACQSC